MSGNQEQPSIDARRPGPYARAVAYTDASVLGLREDLNHVREETVEKLQTEITALQTELERAEHGRVKERMTVRLVFLCLGVGFTLVLSVFPIPEHFVMVLVVLPEVSHAICERVRGL